MKLPGGIARIWGRLQPQDAVRERDIAYGRLWLMRNGVPSQAMDTLAAGPFLAACAIYLGASNVVVGLLAAVPHLVQFVQLLGVWLVERYRARRLVCVVAATLGRVMYLPMIMAMFVPSDELALTILVIGVTLRYVFGAVVTAGWNAWIPDLIPQERRSEFFARRLRLMAIVGTGFSLGAAALVDGWATHDVNGVRYAYATLFAIALACGFASVYCMLRMPEQRPPAPEQRFAFARLVFKPFSDINFRRLMLFLGTWSFATNLAAPFFTVYMLRRLGLDLTLVTFLMILSQFANVAVMQLWGHIADRYSNKSVLAVCGPMFILCIFFWTFTTFPDRHALTIPLLIAIHVLTGVATAGVTLASTAIGMKLAPRGQTNSYLAASSMLSSLAATLAPIAGGLFADFFLSRELSLVIHWSGPDDQRAIPALFVSQWDFFFLIAVAIGLYSLHRLSLVREDGDVDEAIVLHELLVESRRAIRGFSTVAGLKALSELPFELVQRSRRQRRRREMLKRRNANGRQPDG